MPRPHRKNKRQNPIAALVAFIFIAAFVVIGLSPSITGFVKGSPAVMPTPAAETVSEAAETAAAPVETPEPVATPVPDVLAFPGGTAVDLNMKRISLDALNSSNAAKAADLLSVMPELTLVDLNGSELDSASLVKLCYAAPDVRFMYDFELLGQSVSLRTETLDLTGLAHDDVVTTAEYLSCMPQLTMVDLGSETSSPELTWEDIGILEEAAPWAKFDYNYSLCGKQFSTADGLMNLSHVKMDDGGAAVRAVMPYVYAKYLDMDSCGVSNEQMASLRDDFPGTKVVWRIWFGPTGAYTVRTDVTRILASKPSRAGNLTASSIDSIKYCTDLKYLDIGHNDPLDSCDFLNYMPNLTALIVAMDNISDLSPLATCTHMEYLEIFSMPYLSDISVLEGLTELKHLGIQHNAQLTDIRAIMNLDLERLWIGPDYKFPYAQIEEFQSYHPYCEINLTTQGDNMGDWRYTSYDLNTGVFAYVTRYRFLRDQMGYSILLYSFPENDPKY